MDTRNKMIPDKETSRSVRLSFKLFRCFVYISVTTACVLQSWTTLMDYFKYATMTHAHFFEFYDKSTPPGVVFCVGINDDALRQEFKIRNIFTGKNILNDADGAWMAKLKASGVLEGQEKVSWRKYIKDDKYCLHIRINNVFSRSRLRQPAHFLPFVGIPFYYTADFSTQPIHSNSTPFRTEYDCRARVAYFQILSLETYIYSPDNPFAVKLVCTRKVMRLHVVLSALLSMTFKLPPPYDTNCLNYQKLVFKNEKERILSPHHCYDKCVKNFTAEWNLIPDTTVIEREIYENSKIDIATMNVVADVRMLTNMTHQQHNTNLMSRYFELQKRWEWIEKTCKDQCARASCVELKIVPSIFHFEEEGKTNDSNVLLSSIKVTARLSDTPVLSVTYKPKSNFLDFFVYITGSISFWLGVCPMDLTNFLESRMRALIATWKKAGNVTRIAGQTAQT